MTEEYYFPKTRINAKVSELVVEGYHITIDDYVYEKLSRKPKGRAIRRKLLNVDEQSRIIIYS